MFMRKLASLIFSVLFILHGSSLMAEIPDRFVEYVESDGTAYLDTGIRPLPKYTRLVAEIVPMKSMSGPAGILGSSTGTASQNCYLYHVNWKLNSPWSGGVAISWTAGERHVLDIRETLLFVNGELHMQSNNGIADKSANEGASLYLFNYNDNGVPYSKGGYPQRLYGARIYRDGENLDMALVPCVKDGRAGLYDAVGGNILYPAAGELLASESDHPFVRVSSGKVEAKLSVSAGEGGGLAGPGSGFVEVGSTVSFSASPDSGKIALFTSNAFGTIAPWSGAGNEFSFEMPPFGVDVSVSFPNDGEAPFVSDLNGLISATAENGTLQLAEGTYRIQKTIIVDKPIKILGKGMDKTRIVPAANTGFRAIEMTAAATLEGFSVGGFTNRLGGTCLSMSAGSVSSVRIHGNLQRKHNLLNGVGVAISSGTIENSVIENNRCESTYGGIRGIGLYMTGGTLKDSVVRRNIRFRCEHYGAGIAISGPASVINCRIDSNGSEGHGHDNVNTTRGTGIYMDGNGLVDRCVIVSNDISAISMTRGTVRNSLVFGHYMSSAKYPSGVEMQGGVLQNNTITQNYTTGSFSGLKMTGGTAENNIIYGNGTAGDILVSGGAFNCNIAESLTGCTTASAAGNLAATPQFLDPAKGDFRIGIDSPAFDAGKEIAECATDLLGVARPQNGFYDIGAYEHVVGSGALEAAIVVASLVSKAPAAPQIFARVFGGSGNYALTWYLDGERMDDTSPSPSFPALAPGKHSLGLVVSDGTETKTIDLPNAFSVLPVTVYVSHGGQKTFPYDTPEKATDSLSDAIAALWKDSATASTVVVAEGEYGSGVAVVFTTPMAISGAGADKTVLNGGDFPFTGFSLENDSALLEGCTITGYKSNSESAAVKISKGTVQNCRITNNKSIKPSGGALSAPGVQMSGGRLLGCLVDRNEPNPVWGYTQGCGIYMTGGLVEGCQIVSNTCWRAQTRGIGVYMTGGKLLGSVVAQNKNSQTDTDGSGIWASGGTISGCTVSSNGVNGIFNIGARIENTLVYGHNVATENSSVPYAGVRQQKGSMVNCTIADNFMPVSKSVANLNMGGGTLKNCVVFNGESPSFAITAGTLSHCLMDGPAPAPSNLLSVESAFQTSVSPFIGKGDGRYAIRRASLAFNGGDSSVWSGVTDAKDILGRPRIAYGAVDLGAFEYSRPLPMALFLK